jgi:hypothetical protein
VKYVNPSQPSQVGLIREGNVEQIPLYAMPLSLCFVEKPLCNF